MDNDAFHQRWVVPTVYDSTPLYGVRLVNYLINKQNKNPNGRTKVYMIPAGENKLLYSNNCTQPRFEIWIGKKSSTGDPGAFYNDEVNNKSILIRINNTLMAGDCLYRYWPEDLKKNLNTVEQLVVPHHGCSLRKYKDNDCQNEIPDALDENK